MSRRIEATSTWNVIPHENTFFALVPNFIINDTVCSLLMWDGNVNVCGVYWWGCCRCGGWVDGVWGSPSSKVVASQYLALDEIPFRPNYAHPSASMDCFSRLF